MKKVTINGVEFCNFGPNNYSNGMSLISCYPAPKDIVSDVLAGKYEGVYLNPSARCGEEFFGVLGTAEQYKEFKERQEAAQISAKIINKAGGFDALRELPVDEYRKIEESVRSTYKNWWESVS